MAGVPLTALGQLWWRTWTGLVAGDVAALCVAGAALGDIYCRFAWQVWHLATYTFVLRGRHGTWSHPPAFCVAGVPLTALGRLWWRAWTGLVACDAAALLRGRRGTWRHLPSFCVAGVALVALGWLCWRACTGLVSGDAAAFCVAGVALGDIYFGFAWQAWHLVTIYFGFAWQACHLRHWAGSGGALGPD